MNKFSQEKSLLAVYPTDQYGYFRFNPFKKHFKEIYRLNYPRLVYTKGILNSEKEILDIILREKIDVLVYCPFSTDHQLSVYFLNSLRKKVKVVFWSADDATYFESYCKYYAQAADAVITSDYFSVIAYKRFGIPAVLCQDIVACSSLADPAAPRNIDVCFIGDMTKKGRGGYIKYLEDNGINPVVYGFGSRGGYLPHEKVTEFLARSKIVLNFSQISELDWVNSDEPLLNRLRQNTARPKEVALAGALCLSEYSPGLDMMFKPGEEIDVFRSKEELLAKIRYYLSDPGKREIMAAAAHKRARDNYLPDISAQRTVEDLLETLNNPLSANFFKSEIFLSDAFKAKAINSLTFSMFVMLKHLKIRYAIETFFILFKHGLVSFMFGFCGGMIRALRNMLETARTWIAVKPAHKA